MNPVNFIKTVSAKQQLEMQQWTKISTLVCILGTGAMVYMLAPHLMRLQEVYREKRSVEQKLRATSAVSFQEYEKVQAQLVMVKKQQEKIKKLEHQPRLMVEHVQAVAGVVSKDMHVQNIKCDQKETILHLRCKSADAALAAVNTLEKSRFFTGVRLAALQHAAGELPLQVTVVARCV